MMLILALPALAADADFYFAAGGNADGSFTLNAAQPVGVALQAEADFGYRTGIFGINGQIDVHIDPLASEFLAPGDDIIFCHTGTILACPRPVEELNVQLGGDSWRVQGGIVAPPMGIEGWDTWNNTLPVFSEVFAAQSGTVLGGLAGYTIGDGGPEVYAFGGYDTSWIEPEFGAGIAYDSDGFGTWSGVYGMPVLGYYGALAGFSFYLGDAATLNVSALGAFGDYVGGVAATGFGQLVLFPNGAVQPSLRVAGTYDPAGAFGFAPLSVAAGVNIVPIDWLGIQASADAGLFGPAVNPRFTVGVNIIPQLPE